jgi:hypothetical protein
MMMGLVMLVLYDIFANWVANSVNPFYLVAPTTFWGFLISSHCLDPPPPPLQFASDGRRVYFHYTMPESIPINTATITVNTTLSMSPEERTAKTEKLLKRVDEMRARVKKNEKLNPHSL